MDRRLAKFEGEVKGENADQEDSYLSDLDSLAHRTRAKIQVGACPAPGEGLRPVRHDKLALRCAVEPFVLIGRQC